MDLGTLSASLSLDSSGFQDGLSAATDALNSFASIAGGAFAGVEGAMAANAIGEGLSAIGSYAVDTASQVQDFSSSSSIAMNDTATAFNAAVAQFSAGASATGSSGAAAADALQKYQEKVQEIQQNIADVMAGTNITDAITKYNDTLTADQEAYADKVQQINDEIASTQQDLLDTEAENAQKMQDTLADMQMSQADKMADTKEKQAQELSNTTSAVEKAALEKKFAQENQLAEDSYNRAYATKQTELQRNLDQENAKAKEASDDKIANYQAELAKEADLESEKEAKLKQQEDAEIARLQDENAKKLAMYQRELADEERSYAESQAKRAGGGSKAASGGVMGNLQITTKAFTGDLAMSNTELSTLNQYIDNLSGKTPFTQMELEQTAQRAQNVNLNFEKVGNTLTDLAAAKGKTPLEALNAVIMATHGRTVMLQTQFGITAADLDYVLGKSASNIKFSRNELVEGIEKVNAAMGYTGAAEAMGQTYSGQLQRVNNNIRDVALGIMGLTFDAKTGGDTVEKGGLLYELEQGATALAKWIHDNRAELISFGKQVGESLLQAGKIIGEVAKFIIDHWSVIGPILATVGLAFGVIIPVLSVLATAFAIFNAVVAAFAVGGIGAGLMTIIAALGGPIVWLGLLVAALAVAYSTNFLHIRDIVNTVVKFLVGLFLDIGKWLGSSGLLAVLVRGIVAPFTTSFDLVKNAAAVFVDIIEGHWGKLWTDTKKLMTDIIALFIDMVPGMSAWGMNLAKAFVDGFINILKTLKDQISGALQWIMKVIQGKSPPTEGPLQHIDEWGYNVGMAWADSFTKAVSSISLPSSIASGLGGVGTMNYNTQNNLRTSNVTLNNNFHISGQASAQNMVEYMAFQSNHFGAV